MLPRVLHMHVHVGDVALGHQALSVFLSVAVVVADMLSELRVIIFLPPLVFDEEVPLQD